MGYNWKMGVGSYTLGNYRFQIDPIDYPDEHQSIELPEIYVEGLDGDGEIQAWEASYSKYIQEFEWGAMPDEMYQELFSYKSQSIDDRSITFEFTYHNKDPEETWTVKLADLTGTKIRNVWFNVVLKIRLLEIAE